MGSSATPPWMTELLAKNRKVVRTMRSTESYFDGDGDKMSQFSSPTGENKNKVVDPLSPSEKEATTSATSNSTVKSQGRISALVDQQMGKSRRSSTEKPSPIREDSRFMDDVEVKGKHQQTHIMMRSEEQESILEYGPGIVRKLRSRYQSLALRQYSSRPSLRRSASLENVLDADSSGEGIIISKRESPSPTPFDERSHYHKSATTDGNVDNNIMTQYGSSILDENNKIAGVERKTLAAPGPRGRTTLSERRDRMRRARSVDALHRTKHEEEILEKFKAVVLPKEEIVIIEVSKPRANLNGLGLSNNSSNNNSSAGGGGYYLGTSSDKPYPTQLFISADKPNSGLTLATSATESQSGLRGSRSFISPEHELPPHDIVRETARIFEKNQENLSINGNKKVGQALRLSKSYSSSGISSTIAQSPPPPSPTLQQQQQQPQQLQRGTVMAQGTPSMQQLAAAEKRDKSPSAGLSFNGSSNSTVTANKSNATTTHTSTHGLKQVGVIRPTVSHPTSPLNLTNGDKVARKNDTRPLALSPILSPSQQPFKTFLRENSREKPPLSPKPIFTSSPRPTTTNSNTVVNNQQQKTAQNVGSPSSTNQQQSDLVNHSAEKPTIIVQRSKDIASPVNKNIANFNNGIANTSSSRVRSPSSEDHHSGLAKIVNGNTSNNNNDSSSSSSVVSSPIKLESNENSSSITNTSVGRESPTSAATLKRSQFSGPLKQVNNSFNKPSSNSIETTAPPPLKPRISPPQVNGVKTSITTTEPKLHNHNTNNNKTVIIKKEEQQQQPKVLNNVNVKLEAKVVAPPPLVPASSTNSNNSKVVEDKSSSQLRAHQKQKSNQNGNASMVFNFTTRSSVPDYIEDDGLHKGRITLAGTVTDESVDDVDSPSDLKIDAKAIKFVGGDVIINGKSSLQKQPKSQKFNISFNEDATTTYEYPSESSLLAEEEANDKDMLGHKGPSVMNTSGTGLGSYTPKQANSDYQLGNFVDPSITKKVDNMKNKQTKESELIEDYLKPDSENTTWSNELTADIMF